jgi:methyl coenzyme M reductase subunit C
LFDDGIFVVVDIELFLVAMGCIDRVSTGPVCVITFPLIHDTITHFSRLS